MSETSLMSAMQEKYIEFLVKPVIELNGLGSEKIKLDFGSFSQKKDKLYLLKFEIPYAKQSIVLEMYFNPLYPELGPDIILNEEDYPQQTSIKSFITHLNPTLQRWNTADQKSILYIIKEFVYLYKLCQLHILTTLPNSTGLNPDEFGQKIPFENFEINVSNCKKKGEIRLLTKFKLDLSSALGYIEKTDAVEILLYINFNGPMFNRAVPELQLPIYLEDLFDGSDSLHIPPYTEGQSVSDYIGKLKKHIIEKANTIFEAVEKRKQFITTLLAVQNGEIIEYDAVNFTSVSLLFGYNNIDFLLTFKIPLNFPIKPFSIEISSVHHMTDQGKPATKVVTGFPYNSRWEPKRMYIEAIGHILSKEIRKFETASLRRYNSYNY